MTNSSLPDNDPQPFEEFYGTIKNIAAIFYWFIAFILIGLIAGILILFSHGDTLGMILTAATILPVLGSLYLVRIRKFEAVAIFLAVLLLTFITAIATDGLGIHHISVLGYPAILIVASLVIRKRTMVFLTLYNLLCVAWLVFGELSNAYTPSTLVRSVPGDFFSTAVILVSTALMVRLISESLFDTNRKLKNELKERKLAEEVLREGEERYRTLFNGMLDGVYRSTHDGRFIDVNAAMIRMFGYDGREEMLALDIKKDMYFDIKERESLFLDTDQEKVDVFRMRRKDGSEIWVEDHGHYVHDEQGNVIFHEGILRDITPRLIIEAERERLIRELAAKNSETETLSESLATIVGTFEFAQIIQNILEQIKHVIPYDTASVWRLEGNVQKLVGGRDLPPAIAESNIEFKTDATNSALPIIEGWAPYILNNNVQEELVDFKAPHDYVNSWLAVPLKTRGKIIGVIALDGMQKNQFNEHHAELAVTFADQVAIALENARLFSDLQTELADRKKLIAELESKNAELERFTYTVSHDLKSPLVTINGFLGYLENDMVSGNLERAKLDKQRIQEAVDRMYALLNDLLELSRIGRMMNAPEIIPFNDLVGEAIQTVFGQLEARGVKVNVEENLPAVYGDRQRLVQVLQNLIDNAAKFMGNQPKPRIEIGQRGEENGRPIFFVKDNGAGILPEHHERVFGLFNKLDPKTTGTGIGLSLVKRIIEVHEGRIWVESEIGMGSTFYFTLAGEQNPAS